MIKRTDFGALFAIHASREIDSAVYSRIRDLAPELFRGPGCAEIRTEMPWYALSRVTSAVIGVARIDKVLEGGWNAESIREFADTISFSDGSLLGHEQLRWFFGPVGYLTREAVAIAKPVPCRGQLGFWTLPDDVCNAVTAQLG